MSAFLDNIAAAVLGGVMARHVYKGRVCVGFLAAIVAASNAGGAGSVIGDTTTTLMWLHGVSPMLVLPAYIAAFPSGLQDQPVVAPRLGLTAARCLVVHESSIAYLERNRLFRYNNGTLSSVPLL